MKIAIIGTAGRKEDGPKMSLELFEKMKRDASGQIATITLDCACIGNDPFIPLEDGTHLVSGGAAWSDHVAVSLYLMGLCDTLVLYLPCLFNAKLSRFCGVIGSHPGGGVQKSASDRIADTANYYHEKFSQKINIDSLADIKEAMDKGADMSVITGGFHARNMFVGKADAIIAYTWGDGDVPKDGGTKHTWDNSMAKIKIHRPLGKL